MDKTHENIVLVGILVISVAWILYGMWEKASSDREELEYQIHHIYHEILLPGQREELNTWREERIFMQDMRDEAKGPNDPDDSREMHRRH